MRESTAGRELDYHAILKDLGAAGDGLAGMVDDGVGIVLDGAGEVVLVADLDGLADGVLYPRRHWRRRVRVSRIGGIWLCSWLCFGID